MNTTVEHDIHPSRNISLDDVTQLLVRRKIISATTAKQATNSINPDDERHPFSQLGDLELRDPTDPKLNLSTETITRLIAEACNLPYFRIDPLKIDV